MPLGTGTTTKIVAQADHLNCLRHCDVICDMWSHAFTVFRDVNALSDWKKRFIKHRSLHLFIPNVNKMYER